jgi:hypothetical protein
MAKSRAPADPVDRHPEESAAPPAPAQVPGTPWRRISVPPPPIVAAALSGFVVGAVVTLVLTGVMTRHIGSASPTVTIPQSTSVADPQMFLRIRRIVDRVLGPQPGTKLSRRMSIELLPATCLPDRKQCPSGLPAYQSVVIKFRLLNHPLGPQWRLRTAKGDIFATMKALYTSQLPIFNVEMDGYFPLNNGHTTALSRVMTAYITYPRADQIPWKHWQRDKEGELWKRLTYVQVNPRFG